MDSRSAFRLSSTADMNAHSPSPRSSTSSLSRSSGLTLGFPPTSTDGAASTNPNPSPPAFAAPVDAIVSWFVGGRGRDSQSAQPCLPCRPGPLRCVRATRAVCRRRPDVLCEGALTTRSSWAPELEMLGHEASAGPAVILGLVGSGYELRCTTSHFGDTTAYNERRAASAFAESLRGSARNMSGCCPPERGTCSRLRRRYTAIMLFP